MQQVLYAIGLLASLCGLALMLRYGFRLHRRIEFGGTLPAADLADVEEIRQHNDDVKGRFGFFLVMLGVAMLAASSYCVWLRL